MRCCNTNGVKCLQFFLFKLEVILRSILGSDLFIPMIIWTFNFFIFFYLEPAINEPSIKVCSFHINFISVQRNLYIPSYFFYSTIPYNNSSIFNRISWFCMNHGMGQSPHPRIVPMDILHRLGLCPQGRYH